MRKTFIVVALAWAAAGWMALAAGAHAQSIPTEEEIIRALSPRPGKFSPTRSLSGARGIKVTAGRNSVPSIDLKVNFAFDSTRLDNESLLTLNVLGRALSSEALRGQNIEIVGHTDAKGTDEYNEALSQRRAAAVVSYIVQNFDVDGSLISSKGMGERQLLDKGNPEAGVNRRVEIRNITR
ncbi:MAG: OmpA family protein [Deltaproteobacteria bacterium]|nr:OmpA family protein [Deltaproteobacteria bacterium]